MPPARTRSRVGRIRSRALSSRAIGAAQLLVAVALVWLACAASSAGVAVAAVVGASALLAWPRGQSNDSSVAEAPRWTENRLLTATANFAFALGLAAGIALAVRDDDGSTKALIAVAFGIPAAFIAYSVASAASLVLRSSATEFEAHVLVRAAGLAFAASVAGLIVYSVAEGLLDAPSLRAAWALGAAAVIFAVSLTLTRHRYAR